MNNKQSSEKLTFYELINRHKIEIPIMQRDYAQGRERYEEIRTNFLKSLFEIVNDKKLELDFVYGSVKMNKDGLTTFQPLDGQQRLTTLFLLHWFVAIKENKLDDQLKILLAKFTYETRISSREFCNDLINKGIVYNKEKTISKQIIDSFWFFLSWERDPTIKSMLTMLDAIQKHFGSEMKVWDKLDNICFHYIELQNFGLSDDLYIKMNARGKSLTDFENFKAKFEQYIVQMDWEMNINPAESFSFKIDTIWTDLFWNSHDEISKFYDVQILNFFRIMALFNYALKGNTRGKDEEFEKFVRVLRSRDENNLLIDLPISFNQYLKFDCFDEDYFKTLKATLNKLSDKSGLRTFFTDKTYVNEQEIFKNTIKNDLSLADLVIVFAYYQYLALEENIQVDKFKSWMRIVRNLVEGSRPYLFNNAREFANALGSINDLLKYRNSIVKYFADSQINSLSGFIKEQVIEERDKALLILKNNDWENAIIEIENHKYFNGQIGFLLHWCQMNGEYNLNDFKHYSEKLKAIFGVNGLNNFANFLFERALLTKGDYLLSKGRNHSFLVDSDRDISWKRLLRDNNDKRALLKQLVDSVSVLNLINDLQKIVDEFANKNDWRYYFVKQFEMIAACGREKLIRWNSEFDILLLGTKATYGYHCEYYSYSLFCELKSCFNFTNNKYHIQRSIYEKKFFDFNNYQIAFDVNLKKFIYTQSNDWGNKHEFENRNSVVDFIKQKAVM